MTPTFQIGSAVDVGQQRRGKPNQDAIGIVLPGWFNWRPPLLILSDGMGGYGGGEVASRLAVDTLAKHYRRSRMQNNEFQRFFSTGIQAAHQAIAQKARQHKNLEMMGCTIVAAIITDREVHLANVGDSRAYLVKPKDIFQISYDHSLVAEQMRLGLITEIEARNHPKRNVLSLSLTGRREVASPYLSTQPWSAEDVLVLCSDGLCGVVNIV